MVKKVKQSNRSPLNTADTVVETTQPTVSATMPTLDYSAPQWRRLISMSSLRKLPGMKGLRHKSPEYRHLAISHLTAWLDAYKPVLSDETEVSPKVEAAVYRAFSAIGENKPMSRSLLTMKVYQLLKDTSWDDRMSALERQIEQVVANPEHFTVKRGPVGGTVWLGTKPSTDT